MMNKELLELCKAYAAGQISWQQYRKLRRELIDSIIQLDKDATLPLNYIEK
jgi:hypothetical protein